MLAILSPAKTLDFESPNPCQQLTQPQFLADAQQLIELLQKLSPTKIASLMQLSDALAQLNVARFSQWQPPFSLTNARQAILAFTGDVYVGLNAETLSAQDLVFAQQQLRILSGLYGILRPLDLIQPYRLEMGTALENLRGKNLYAFWGQQLTDAINHQLQSTDAVCLVNLASHEYFSVLQPKKIIRPIITPVFKDEKKGVFKVISFFAKKARGQMAAYMIRHRLTQPAALQSFSVDGYEYRPALSSELEWVFCREAPFSNSD